MKNLIIGGVFVLVCFLQCTTKINTIEKNTIPRRLLEGELLNDNCFLREINYFMFSDSLIRIVAVCNYGKGRKLYCSDTITVKKSEGLLLEQKNCLMIGKGDAYEMTSLKMLNDSVGYWATEDFMYRPVGFLFKIDYKNGFRFINKIPNRFSGESPVIFFDESTGLILTLHDDYGDIESGGEIVIQYLYDNERFEPQKTYYNYSGDYLARAKIGKVGLYNVWKRFEGVMLLNYRSERKILLPQKNEHL